MTDKELDDLFQKSFSAHQMPVPADMWERVNPQKEKRRRGLILWWSGLGVAALFVLVGTATWLYHTSEKQKLVAKTISKSVNPKQDNASTKTTIPITPPVGASLKEDSPNGLAKEKLSSDLMSNESLSQITQQHSRTDNHIAGLYTHQTKQKNNPVTTVNKLQNAASYGANDIHKNQQDNGTVSIQQSNKEVSNNKSDETSEPVITSNSNDVKLPQSNPLSALAQTLDSNANFANNTATQASKAAIKVKKIHCEKNTGLELMIAGYGNRRHVYDLSQFSVAGLVPFGPVNQKEKVLMNSFSITARLDKPLTKNISLKTGLQFLQTNQQVSYDYETVIPSISVSALNNDTTMSARLQSKQSLVKGTYNSLSVPVLISYHTNGTKLSLGATAGVLVNVRSWYKGNVPDAGNNHIAAAKSIFRTRTGPSLYAGLTVAKQVGGFQLFAEPHIQYTLSSITKSSASFRQKITSYGFGIGIRKAIGK